MTRHVSLEVVDADGGRRDDERGIPRAEFLRRAVFAGGTLLVGGVALAGLPRLSSAAPSPSMDVEIFNFLLLLERLQASFYDEAVGGRALSGEMAEFAEVVGEQERAHVEFLEGLLGNDAEAQPSFDLGDSTGSNDKFAAAALMIEETTAAAYIGQGANLTRKRILDAARIVSVEARHVAWMRDMLGKNPAPLAADEALPQDEVLSTLRNEGFIS